MSDQLGSTDSLTTHTGNDTVGAGVVDVGAALDWGASFGRTASTQSESGSSAPGKDGAGKGKAGRGPSSLSARAPLMDPSMLSTLYSAMLLNAATPDDPASAGSAAGAAVDSAASAMLSAAEVQELTDEQLLVTAAAVEQQGRHVDASRVAVAAEIADRARKDLGSDSLSTKKGCRNAVELLERVTLVSAATAARRIRLGAGLRPQSGLSGTPVPPMFPAVADALDKGRIGVDAATAITDRLRATIKTAGLTDMQKAEAGLVRAATGTTNTTDIADSTNTANGTDAVGRVPVPCTADDIRRQAEVLQSFLDPDGAIPAEETAMANRGIGKGMLNKNGLMSGRFAMMPETYAGLQRLFDAYMATSSAPTFLTEEEHTIKRLEKDPRSWQQQRHDILASVIDTMSRSGIPPLIGGAAPTVLVSVRAKDLECGRGVGWIDGQEAPISMRAVKQFTCTGGTQTIVIDEHGAVIELGSPQRVFTANQRKAIMLRDGACIIPGCNIPAGWTEIHHVIPHEHDGPTEIRNGCCLCWFHHRTIETSGWQIKMINGAPHIKAPAWLETGGPWRPTTKSCTTLTNQIQHPPGDPPTELW